LNLSRILEKGYLPKELPPPFTSKTFGKKSRYITKKWKDYETELKEQLPSENSKNQAKKRFEPILKKHKLSKLFEYNIAKGKFSRRKIEIPHPQSYLNLCEKIVENWNLIKETHDLSTFSESKLYSETKIKRSVRTKSRSWSKFRNKLTEVSFNYKVQLKIDITNFYPTIYTHTIPWSLLGKEDSKKYFQLKSENNHNFIALTQTDNKAKKYQIGDNIDSLVRNCNDKQSIGLPIGPDSSFILSEMLASRIDNEIAENLTGFDYKCIRYYDDYYFYLNSVSDAETVLKRTQKILYNYKLEANENKVEIKELPYFQSDLWNIEIHNYKFKETDITDIQELEYYFSLIFKLVEENRDKSSWIISYALTRFEFGKVKIRKENINIFISLILKTLYLETSTIDQIFKIIYTYRTFLERKELNKIKILLDKLIDEHILLNHSFEIAWGLWFFKTFDINCEVSLLQKILDSEDQISILISLDIINNKPINKNKFDFSKLNSMLNSNNLYSEFWLINYEIEIKDWITNNLNSTITHKFFEILKKYEVSFYNINNQVKTNFNLSNQFSPFVDIPDFFNHSQAEDDEDEDEDY
tara:strand:- start:244 stop:1995 length:1752 start_codon:yes stop_codon:yes gene_type:complete